MGEQAALEIPFPQQACLVLDTRGPAEAHIKEVAAVLIILPLSVSLSPYFLTSVSVSIYMHDTFTTEEQLYAFSF